MEIFYYGMVVLIEKADVSYFKENEIRSLNCQMTIEELEKAESIKIPLIEPCIGDFGINKEKELFNYQESGWKSFK